VIDRANFDSRRQASSRQASEPQPTSETSNALFGVRNGLTEHPTRSMTQRSTAMFSNTLSGLSREIDAD